MKKRPISAMLLALAFMAIRTFAGGSPGAQEAVSRNDGQPDARSILAKLESNMVYDSIEYEGSMEIRSNGKIKIKTMRTWSTGPDRAFVEFTNPEDRGVRMLKLGENLWMYFPSERDTIKISGHLLTQGMMGSDLSYAEALEPESLSKSYDTVWLKTEEALGRKAYLLELTAKTQNAAYAKRRLWIDAECYVVLKSELFAKSGKLLKETETLDVLKIGSRWFPSRTVMRDKLKKNSETVFAMTLLRIDTKIDVSMFSLQALAR